MINKHELCSHTVERLRKTVLRVRDWVAGLWATVKK